MLSSWRISQLLFLLVFLLYDYSNMDKVWHSFPIEKIFSQLKSGPKGLTEKEAGLRLKRSGYNKLPEEKSFSKTKIFLAQFKSPLVYILLIAGVVTLVLEDYTDSIIIFGAVFLNTIVGYIQENKADQGLKKLKKILRVKAIVFREGLEKEIFQRNVVVGDIVFLRAGNKVPADARIIQAHDLKAKESALTGEWLAAEKKVIVLSEDVPLADRDNMVYMGTIIESGWGKAIVTGTGLQTEIGKVAESIQSTKEKKTPYQKKLSHFSKIIGIIIVIISLFIFIEGMAFGGEFVEMFSTSVAIAVAAIPEGLPVAMTVILALGMQRILKRKGLVRKLASAETLGSTSVILTDKTGTLTEAKMEVASVYAGSKELLVSNSDGSVNSSESHLLALKIGMLCNESFVENLEEPTKRWIIRGRPTEKALLIAGIQAGLSKESFEKEQPMIDQFLFDPAYKYAASLHKFNPGNNILYLVGSPEKILDMSAYLGDGQKRKLLLADLKKIKEKINKTTNAGLRVVGVAYRETKDQKIDPDQEEKEKELTFVGFFALHDPIRESTKGAIDICRQAGMRPIIVTGDHKLTAQTVAHKLGFKIKPKNILEGKDLAKLSDSEFEDRIKDIQIYARVEPAQKLRIVQAWQKKGEVVAMTGDGINDAPALNQADIGVSLGSGTDVAKEVSDLVLLTDNFNVIVAAIEEGRVIVDNIRKVITYLLSDSFSEIVLIGVSLISGWPLPILAAQILWVNLIEDGPMGIALAFEKKEKNVMAQKPAHYGLFLLTKEMKALILIISITTNILLLALFYYLLKHTNYEIIHIRSVIFAALTIDSLFYIFACKSLRRNIWRINPFSNMFLIWGWVFGIVMLLAAIYLPLLQSLLKTVPLNLFDWMLVLGVGLITMFLIELTKYYFITRHETTI